MNTRDCKMRLAGMYGDQLVDATGARRRRQALAYMGWGPRELAPLLGFVNDVSVRMSTNKPRIRKSTHDRWVRVYRQLSIRRGPNDDARRAADRAGWLGPTSWDDIDHDRQPGVRRTRPAGERCA